MQCGEDGRLWGMPADGFHINDDDQMCQEEFKVAGKFEARKKRILERFHTLARADIIMNSSVLNMKKFGAETIEKRSSVSAFQISFNSPKVDVIAVQEDIL